MGEITDLVCYIDIIEWGYLKDTVNLHIWNLRLRSGPSALRTHVIMKLHDDPRILQQKISKSIKKSRRKIIEDRSMKIGLMIFKKMLKGPPPLFHMSVLFQTGAPFWWPGLGAGRLTFGTLRTDEAEQMF